MSVIEKPSWGKQVRLFLFGLLLLAIIWVASLYFMQMYDRVLNQFPVMYMLPWMGRLLVAVVAGVEIYRMSRMGKVHADSKHNLNLLPWYWTRVIPTLFLLSNCLVYLVSGSVVMTGLFVLIGALHGIWAYVYYQRHIREVGKGKISPWLGIVLVVLMLLIALFFMVTLGFYLVGTGQTTIGSFVFATNIALYFALLFAGIQKLLFDQIRI